MSCDITSGRARQCKKFLGGQSSLYLFNFVDDPFTIVAGEATAISPSLTTVYEYVLEGDGNTLVENMVPDRNTGTRVNTQTLTIVLKGISAADSNQFNLLSSGFPQAVVKDRNGVYHAVGLDDGIDFSVGSQTGGAKTDLYGFTLTGVSTTKDLSPKLDSATVTAFLALVS